MSRIVRVLLFVAAAVAALILAAAVALFTLLDTKSVEAAFSRLTHDAFGTDVSDAAIRKAVAEHNRVCTLIRALGDFRKEAR